MEKLNRIISQKIKIAMKNLTIKKCEEANKLLELHYHIKVKHIRATSTQK